MVVCVAGRRKEFTMFTAEQRDHVRQRVLALAQSDPRAIAGALTGSTHQLKARPQPNASSLIGLCWHHVLHARACIERHKPWQAEYWISEMHHHILELACLRLGENTLEGRGFDRLPSRVREPLAEALVRSLTEAELRRALAVATRCLIAELEVWDSPLCARLSPLLHEFGVPQAEARTPSSPNVLAEQEG